MSVQLRFVLFRVQVYVAVEMRAAVGRGGARAARVRAAGVVVMQAAVGRERRRVCH